MKSNSKLLALSLATFFVLPDNSMNAVAGPSVTEEPQEKVTLLAIAAVGAVVVIAGTGIYVALKLRRKFSSPTSPFNPTNRFGTNLFTSLNRTNGMSLVCGEASDLPFLLILGDAKSEGGLYAVEFSTNLSDWTILARCDLGEIVIHTNAPERCFYRVVQ